MQLETEGFSDVSLVSIRPGDLPAETHTHDQETVHIIMKGKLMITDEAGVTTTYEVGDRVDFPAGTTHTAATGPEGMQMIVGVKR